MRIGITRRPIVASTHAPAAILDEMLARIASIRGRASAWGVMNDATMAEYLAGQSIEADFTQGYYRDGFIEAAAPGLLPGWAVSRASEGTATNAAGKVQSFASGEPRITDRGLLVEVAKTNLLLRSQTFDHAIWGRISGGSGLDPVVTANVASAPDGTMTADRIIFDRGGSNAGGDLSFLQQTGIAATNAASYSGSIWLRADTPSTLLARHAGGGAYTSLNVTPNWQRFSHAEIASGTSAEFDFGLRGAIGGSSQTATVEAWGAQLETDSMSSYIATSAATATRAADVVTGPPLESSGTLLVEFEVPPHDGVVHRLLTFPDHLPLWVLNGVVSTSIPAATLPAPGAALAAGSVGRAAVTWEAGRRAIVRNGGAVAADVYPLPSATNVFIGGAALQYGVPIRRFVRFDVAVADLMLRAMTA